MGPVFASFVGSVVLRLVSAQTLSDKADITLGKLDEMCALDANTITKYAWQYPGTECHDIDAGDDLDLKFKKTGGFVYFNSKDEVVCKTSLGPEANHGIALSWGTPTKVEKSDCKHFAPITLGPFHDQGATAYCWEPTKANIKGFHYKMKDGEIIEFPMESDATKVVKGDFPDALPTFYLHKISLNTDSDCSNMLVSGVAPNSLAVSILIAMFVTSIVV